MQNKKLEWARLGIYIFLSYALSWIPCIILNVKYGGYTEWVGLPEVALVSMLMACGPAAANVLTRLITKEGWKDSLLHLRVKGNIRYYLFGMLFPLGCELIAGVILCMMYGVALEAEDVASYIGMVMFMTGYAISIAFYCFGEEFGWRGYMNQKMEPLLGTTGTVIVGGIVWGAWHAPLTVTGHNFGTEYWGFPWLGIVVMCVMCTGMGAAMMWVTKKTGSVYPTSILHTVFNYVCSYLVFGIAAIPEEMSGQGEFWMEILFMIPVTVIGILFLPLMLKENKKAAVSQEIQGEKQAA